MAVLVRVHGCFGMGCRVGRHLSVPVGREVRGEKSGDAAGRHR